MERGEREPGAVEKFAADVWREWEACLLGGARSPLRQAGPSRARRRASSRVDCGGVASVARLGSCPAVEKQAGAS
ncbi:unnamed protein product [Lampetra planeri]